MTSKYLLLRLPLDDQSPVYWLEFSKEADSVKPEDWGTLSSVAELSHLSEKAAHSRITVLVPGELVGIHSVAVSGRITNQVKKSLPYRLEEDISSDVDDLHVAILGRQEDTLYLGAVENHWMALWSGWLEEAGLQSRQWLPDTLAVPWQEGQCSIMPFEKNWLVRYGSWHLASCDNHWLPLLLEGIESPEPLESRQLDHTHESPLVLLAAEASRSSVNLLQDTWAPKSTRTYRLKPWRVSLVLASLLMVSWIGSSLLNVWQINQSADQLQHQSRQVYQQLFPGERVIRLMPQLNRKLQALQQAQQPDTGVLQQLNDLVPVFKEYGDIKPVMISYDDSRHVLRITAEAASMASFTGMRDALAASKKVNLESVEQKGKQITGVMVIRGGES